MIQIENDNLANFLMFQLDKIENNFTIEELSTVKELVIDPVDLNGEYFPINLEVLNYFPFLEKISFSGMIIHNKDLKFLEDKEYLERVSFTKCQFEEVQNLKKLSLTELSLINCEFSLFDFISDMTSLESLSITNFNQIDMRLINKLKQLRYLDISYSKVLDLNIKPDLPQLEEISFDNTNIINLYLFFNLLPNLKKISISMNQYEQNKEVLQNLSSKGVSIYEEGMIPILMGDEVND